MSNKTNFLQLILPGLGEYNDRWHEPVNANFEAIDAQFLKIDDELVAARGTAGTLAERLDEALEQDGTPKAIPEVEKSRNSTIYGADDGATDFDLDERLELGDVEVFNARSGLAALRDAAAFVGNDSVADSVVSAPSNYLTFTGANAKVDGSGTPVVANINGYRQVVRALKQVTISGAAGTYYLYLDRSASGELMLDRTGVGQDTGAVGVDGGGKLTKFTDSSQNFVSSGVQAGDVLEITTTGSLNKHKYVIAQVVGATELKIIGRFETAQTGLNYKITYPIGPTLGFTGTAHAKIFTPVTNRIYIGRCVFDGSNITSIVQYALKGRYEEFFSVSAAPDYAINASHALGYMPRSVQFFGSQADDYSAAIEPLAPSAAEGGGVTGNTRSVICDATDSLIRAKNVTASVFYKDFSGSTQTTGFLLIRASR